MRRAWIAMALAASLWAASSEKPRFKRAALTAMELSFDRRLTTLADDPYLLIGPTRGVYLEHYGAVFTAEVSLSNSLAPNPFRPAITKDDIAKTRAAGFVAHLIKPIHMADLEAAIRQAASSQT